MPDVQRPALTKEEADDSLQARLGSFVSGYYWTVFPTEGPELEQLRALEKRKLLRIVRSQIMDHGKTTWVLIHLMVGLAGKLGEEIDAITGTWSKTNRGEAVQAKDLVPDLIETPDPILDAAEALLETADKAKEAAKEAAASGGKALAGAVLTGVAIWTAFQLFKRAK